MVSIYNPVDHVIETIPLSILQEMKLEELLFWLFCECHSDDTVPQAQ